ncbi:MAG TPA: aldehyde dehydrogenase family protein, partial [Polyangiaceae bacterium]|nr:aldehyde dehydrogenase family protein [Polyangiaceae bacterium]
SPRRLRRYAEDIVRRVPVGDGEEILVRRPDGVVLVVTPSSSPTINAGPLFPILLVGNAVIARAPGNDRGLRFIAGVIGDALEEHGFSRSTLTVVTGSSRAIIADILPAEAVRTIVFFGNAVAGRSVARQALELDKKVVLELEGSDHLAVWRDADLERAVASAAHGFDFSSLPCPAPKHMLVHHEVFDEFAEAFTRAAAARSVAIAADPVGGYQIPIPRPEAFDDALAELRELGTVRLGGYRMKADGTPDPLGPYACPTVVTIDAQACLENRLACFEEEVFFPLIPVVRFEGDDERVAADMIELVGRSPFGLRFSLWTEEPSVLARFTRDVDRTGLVIFDDEHTQCPAYASAWGGPGRSGGAAGESHLFWEKTSHLQAIAARRLNREQRAAVLGALGVPSDEDVVRLEVSEGVATITLDRPARHNAFTREMADAFADAVDQVRGRLDEVRCVVVRGSGKSFCSGADHQALAPLDRRGARRFMTEATAAFRALQALPRPVIAAVHGYCMGGGFELALHGDLVVATRDAVFALPETSLGVLTTAGSIARLCATVGLASARDLVLTGRRITGDEARRMGLVSRVVESGELDAALAELTGAIGAAPPGGIAAAKRVFQELTAADQAQSWCAETEAFTDLFDAMEVAR